MNFSEFELNPKIQSGIDFCAYKTPTTVQEKTIPPVLQGQDLIGLAQTGTGKTAAFVLPILEKLLAGKRGKTRSLILSPTRELAEQTLDFVQALGRKTGLRCVSVYGGVSKYRQAQKIKSGAEIIVACPGRLLDLLQDGAVDLSAVETLVLDEGDRMLDMGFMPDIRKILDRLPQKRQNMFFSATMPKDISCLAEEILNDPVWIKAGYKEPLAGIDQCLYPVKKLPKQEMLINLLQDRGAQATLIFTKTKHMASKLAKRLSNAGMRAKELQGDMTQSSRRQVMQGFKNGNFDILVATDVASRGIDVSRIAHVINFDMPDTTEAYTHRIGRTGRIAGEGEASTFVEPREFGLVKAIEKAQDKRLKRKQLDG